MSKALYKQAFIDQFVHLANPEVINSVVGAVKHVGRMVTPEAISGLAHHVGLGTAAHIGSNAAIKAFRGTANNRVMQSLGELGVKHGIEGKQVHPFLMDRIKQVVGPEAVAEYGGSRNLAGKAMSKGKEMLGGAVTPSTAKQLMQPVNGVSPAKMGLETFEHAAKAHLGLKPDTNLSEYPVLGNVHRSASSYFNNGGNLTEHKGLGGRIINAGTKLLDKATTGVNNIKGLANPKVRHVANAGFAAASMAVPGLGDHVLINTAREVATSLPAGHAWVKGRVMQGLNHDNPVKFFGHSGPKVVEGKGIMGKARRAMGDYLYSPTAWGEARDFGVKAKADGFNNDTIKKVTPLLGDVL